MPPTTPAAPPTAFPTEPAAPATVPPTALAALPTAPAAPETAPNAPSHQLPFCAFSVVTVIAESVAETSSCGRELSTDSGRLVRFFFSIKLITCVSDLISGSGLVKID